MRRHCKSQSKSRIKKGIKVGNEELIENSRSYISYITIICICGQRQRAEGLRSGVGGEQLPGAKQPMEGLPGMATQHKRRGK